VSIAGLRNGWAGSLLALGAGALLATAFAPYNYWPLAILCPALLMWLWQDVRPRRAAALGFYFGAGTFALGTWWLYIAIHTIGEAPVWLALALMLALVCIMGAYQALAGYVANRLLPLSGPWRWWVGLPALWLLLEWLRGWFLSGFPWLSLGYSQTDTWLAGYAPVGGVYLISGLLLLCAGSLVALILARSRLQIFSLLLLALPWAGGQLLLSIPWTHATGTALSVAVLQGAIPQDEKHLESNLEPTKALYNNLNEQALGAKLIVWPETAVPELANEMMPFVRSVFQRARQSDSDVVMGIAREDDSGDYFDSVLALSASPAFYDKRHLVPFGEYFPVPKFIRNWLRLMSLPNEDFTAGADHQAPLGAGGFKLAATVCYEDAFGTDQRWMVRQSDALVNVTNDAWFGRSSARYQHFQIARMRAIEARRYLIRAANDGVSAIVGPFGEVLARAPEYQVVILRGTVEPRRGLSPYLRLGDLPVLVTALMALLAALYQRGRGQRSVAEAG
jgi:apolipoprotein N-acyltransferase